MEKRRSAKIKFIFTIILLWFLMTCGAVVKISEAADAPAPTQLVGEHSTLTTFDGSIRDDELADYICSKIPKNDSGVPQVKDVKIMFNSCYGGGMLDDFQRVFGPGGACEGVKWVGSSASTAEQPAWGPSDAAVNSNPAENLGSRWTNALKPAVEAGGNVKGTFETARNNDAAGPNGSNQESPVIASGNGGENIEWNPPDTHHKAIIFGGKNNKLRHNNNIENMWDALAAVWSGATTYEMLFGWGNNDTGTEDYLKGIIDSACTGLNSNTELVLYFDDHGDTHFDMDEFMGWLMPHAISVYEHISFYLHGGWVQGLQAMFDQPGDEPLPTLDINLAEPIIGDEWLIYLNDVLIPLPSGLLTGALNLPVDWRSIQTGANLLEIIPVVTPSSPMLLDNLELSSGPINEIETDDLTLINLTSFTARGLNGKVLLKWETASEIDNAGFNIWRKTGNKGEFIKISPTLIPAEGSPVQGAAYTYTDTNVTNGITYFYLLEDVDINGVSTFHGRDACTYGVDSDCVPVRAKPHKMPYKKK